MSRVSFGLTARCWGILKFRALQILSRRRRVIARVLSHHLTYLDRQALLDLSSRVIEVEHKKIPGIIVEADCALGGSAIVICSSKTTKRSLYLYDVFGMIPPPTEKDGEDVHKRYQVIVSGQAKGLDNQEYYGYHGDLVSEVKFNFESLGFPVDQYNVSLIKGLFQATMHFGCPVALAHIDGDWYDSVYVCLDRIAPVLSVGGWLVIDDYYAWSGCRSAVDDYFHANRGEFRILHNSRLHIQRVLPAQETSTEKNSLTS